MKKYLVLVAAFVFSAECYSATTNKQKIKTLLYNGNADYVFFTSDSGWVVRDSDESVLCSPHYVQVISSVAGRDKIMSIALAAKMGGKQVDFIGECNPTNSSYFNAYYIRMY